MTFFMARGGTASLELSGNGTAASTVNGTTYASKGNITVSANGALASSQLIADTIKLAGNGNLTANFTGPKGKVRKLQLME
jgi:hypothetical protein